MSDLEFSVSSSSLGVDDSLRDTFTVEVSKQVDQVEILKEERAILTNSL